jgi:hypothetical protein
MVAKVVEAELIGYVQRNEHVDVNKLNATYLEACSMGLVTGLVLRDIAVRGFGNRVFTVAYARTSDEYRWFYRIDFQHIALGKQITLLFPEVDHNDKALDRSIGVYSTDALVPAGSISSKVQHMESGLVWLVESEKDKKLKQLLH